MSQEIVIREVTTDVWTFSRPFLRYGWLPLGGRSTAVKLLNGDVWMLVSTPLTDETKDTLASLGPVRYLVAPDMVHYLFIAQYATAYPEAQVIGVHGLVNKFRKQGIDVQFSCVYGSPNRPTLGYEDEIAARFFVGHRNQEMAFLHKASGTLIEADLILNLPSNEQYSRSQLSNNVPVLGTLRPTDRVHRWFNWFVTKDKKQMSRDVRAVAAWEFDRIIPCHGIPSTNTFLPSNCQDSSNQLQLPGPHNSVRAWLGSSCCARWAARRLLSQTTMLLASSLEPNGRKSTVHYTVLHHKEQSCLVKLPKSYLDLEKEVETLFNLDTGQFFIETDSLNLCCEKKVKITSALWADVSTFLGSVYIVPCDNDTFVRETPQSSPEDENQVTSIPTANHGRVKLNAPLVGGGVLVLSLGDIDFGSDSPSLACSSFQLHDEGKKDTLTVNIFPGSGKTIFASSNDSATITRPLKKAFPLSSQHSVIVYKQNKSFILLLDGHYVSSVDGSEHSQLSTLTYDLGALPQTAQRTHYGNGVLRFCRICQGMEPEQPSFSKMGGAMLYDQVLACNPCDTENVMEALASVRGESSVFKNLLHGVTWRHSQIPDREWANFIWDHDSKSIFVVRFTNRDTWFINFGAWSITFGDDRNHLLRIAIDSWNDIKFEETGYWIPTNHLISKVTLPCPLRSPGTHTITFVKNGDKLYAIFDFKRSIPLPGINFFSKKTRGIRCERGPHGDPKAENGDCVHLDVYSFAQ